MKSKASSSRVTGKSKPRSGSLSANWIASLTCSLVKGSSSKICTRLRMAGVTEKKGFSVVAPIMMTRPLSNKGKRKSCLVLSKRWISSKSRTKPPENLASSAISCRRFLLSTVALRSERHTWSYPQWQKQYWSCQSLVGRRESWTRDDWPPPCGG